MKTTKIEQRERAEKEKELERVRDKKRGESQRIDATLFFFPFKKKPANVLFALSRGTESLSPNLFNILSSLSITLSLQSFPFSLLTPIYFRPGDVRVIRGRVAV